MENQFYKTVPVSEGLPEPKEPAELYFVISGDEEDVAYYTKDGWQFVTPVGMVEYPGITAWLRPVPLTLPEEVSDEALTKYLPEYSDVESYQISWYDGAQHIRDTLSPAFASLQEENERLRKLVSDMFAYTVDTECPGEQWEKAEEIHKSLTSK